MIQPSMTIETVHGLRETVVLNNFVVGPTSSKTQDDSKAESNDQQAAPAKSEKQG